MASLLLAAPLAQHMGQLHPYENFIVVAIAFGPFLVLGAVVFFVRRRDVAEETNADSDLPDASESHSGEEQPGAESELSPDRPPTT